MKSVFVVTTSDGLYASLRNNLGEGYSFIRAKERDECSLMLRQQRYDVVFVDIDFLSDHALFQGNGGYGKVIDSFEEKMPFSSHLIIVGPHQRTRDVVNAVKAGAWNYITYPFNHDELRLVVEEAAESIRLQLEVDYLRDQFWDEESVEIARTRNNMMKTVLERVKSVSQTKTTVLITGETGTGKSLIAKLIHRHSSRRDGPFISIHCGAIPDALLESELFGHEKGSFTGAIRKKAGKFEIANGGTIFLDEIGTITPAMQIKLLQVLQDRLFQRVGGEEMLTADVRIIAATNEDLDQRRLENTFRSDLYYRLNVFPVELPPLRERKEDIPLIADTLLARLNRLYGKGIRGITPRVLDAFSSYTWPGNIREMENLIERAYILEKSSYLSAESFPREILPEEDIMPAMTFDTSLPIANVRKRAIETVEQQYLCELLREKRGRIKESAEAAGITTRQLNKLMKKYGLRKEVFKK